MLKKIIGTTGTRILNAGITFLILWITTNYLGKEGVGTISLIILDISVMLLLTDFIGGSAMGYFASRKRISVLVVISYSWTLLIGVLFYFLLMFCSLFPGFYSSVVAEGYEAHIILLAVANALMLINFNILVGLEKIKQYNFVFTLQVVLLALVLSVNIFLLNKHDVLSYVVALYFSLCSSFVVSLVLLLRRIRHMGPERMRRTTGEILQYGSMTQMANIITFINKRFCFFVINRFIGIGSLGVYAASAQLAEGLRIIGQSISLVQFSRIANTRDRNYARVLTIRLLKFTLFITLLALLIILLIPTDFFGLLFGEDFRGIKSVIVVLSPGVLAIAASMIFAHYFSGIGKPKYNMVASVFGLVTALTTVLILVPMYGIIGAGYSASLTYIVSTLYQMVVFVRVSGAKASEFIPTYEDIKVLLQGIGNIIRG